MAVDAADLILLKTAKDFLGTGAPDDEKIQRLITTASKWIESSAPHMAGRPLKERTFTNLRLTGPRSVRFYPPAWPINVIQTITIKVDETAQTIWKQESDGDVDTFDVVVASDDPFDERQGLRNHFYRSLGWGSVLGRLWNPERANIGQNRLLLTYTGGYATIPDDLQQACLYLVQKLWRDQQKQQTGMTVISVPTGGSISIPDPTVPKEVIQLVAPYRRFVLAGV